MQNGVAENLSAEGELVRRADLGLSIPLEDPQSETEKKLAEIWQQALDIDKIGRLDDFFELGGDSLAATSLAAEIEASFGIRFAPGDIISLSTVAAQAAALAPSAPSHAARVPPHMVVGRAEGSKPPLFMVHGARGFSFFKREFLDAVGQDRPIYLFQAPGSRRPHRAAQDRRGDCQRLHSIAPRDPADRSLPSCRDVRGILHCAGDVQSACRQRTKRDALDFARSATRAGRSH